MANAFAASPCAIPAVEAIGVLPLLADCSVPYAPGAIRECPGLLLDLPQPGPPGKHGADGSAGLPGDPGPPGPVGPSGSFFTVLFSVLTIDTHNWDVLGGGGGGGGGSGGGGGGGIYVEVSSTSNVFISGMLPGAPGELRLVRNNGNFPITLAPHDAGSAPANQFSTQDDCAYVLEPGAVAWLVYDGLLAKWVVLQDSQLYYSPTFAVNTPPDLTADQNDYDPGAGFYHRLTVTEPASDIGISINRTLTGMVAGCSGLTFYLINIDGNGEGNTLTLAHQNAGSLVANRFQCPGGGDIIMKPDESAFVWYDPGLGCYRATQLLTVNDLPGLSVGYPSVPASSDINLLLVDPNAGFTLAGAGSGAVTLSQTPANGSQVGYVTGVAQSFSGTKQFNAGISVGEDPGTSSNITGFAAAYNGMRVLNIRETLSFFSSAAGFQVVVNAVGNDAVFAFSIDGQGATGFTFYGNGVDPVFLTIRDGATTYSGATGGDSVGNQFYAGLCYRIGGWGGAGVTINATTITGGTDGDLLIQVAGKLGASTLGALLDAAGGVGGAGTTYGS